MLNIFPIVERKLVIAGDYLRGQGKRRHEVLTYKYPCSRFKRMCGKIGSRLEAGRLAVNLAGSI